MSLLKWIEGEEIRQNWGLLIKIVEDVELEEEDIFIMLFVGMNEWMEEEEYNAVVVDIIIIPWTENMSTSFVSS